MTMNVLPQSKIRNFNTSLLSCLILLIGTGANLGAFAARLSPGELTCEYLTDPLGIDTPQPRLSWKLESQDRGQRQSGYQILVASSKHQLASGTADLWDTGKVPSDETLHIAYTGKPLRAGHSCFWKVRVWDAEGRVSNYSSPASWSMGLLAAGDWAPAKWIGATVDTNSNPAPMFRREFVVRRGLTRALVYVCGLGYYELQLNGRKVGDHLLDPGYTRYDRRALYVTYDVTEDLRRGDNAIGVILGNGWQNVHTKAVWDFHIAPWRAAPKFLLKCVLEYADGGVDTMVSNADWKCGDGPIRFDSIYGGETYDARLERPGWSRAGFDESGWQPALVAEAPKGTLRAQGMPPIRAEHETLRPVKLNQPKPGVFIIDMGQNMAGMAELRVEGQAGTKVVMRYGERLTREGLLDTADIEQHVKKLGASQQHQTDTYILKGRGQEVWRSRFTYHGFQYVEITGFPGTPTLDSLRGVFIHSAIPEVGHFECSSELFNKIWRAGRWAYLSNLQGIPTDCPHREKNGWTGDAHLAAEQGLYGYQPAAVYSKWINDLADEQRPSGELPGIVPTSGWGYTWGNGPAWDSALLLIPFYMYQYCGDTRILTDHLPSFKRYVDYLTTKAKDGIVDIGLNDWAPYKTKTPADITSTAYYYRDAQITALAARLAGNEADAAKYEKLAAEIRRAFNKKFYLSETGSYGNGSQTSLSCALYQGLVPEENRGRVLENLVTAVEKNNNHIDTGILGAKYIMNTLSENGRADVAFRMAAQKDQPSWGWWIEQGATTLWEQWNGSESRNHIMYGDVLAWFYKNVAGIQPDPAAPGFKHFVIKPHLLGDLTSAKASYQSVRGRIDSAWRLSGATLDLDFTVPPNTTATVFVPATSEDAVLEKGKSARNAQGLEFLRKEGNYAVFKAGSGNYTLTSTTVPK